MIAVLLFQRSQKWHTDRERGTVPVKMPRFGSPACACDKAWSGRMLSKMSDIGEKDM